MGACAVTGSVPMSQRNSNTATLFDLNDDHATPLGTSSTTCETSTLLGPWALNSVHAVDCLTALRKMPSDCIDVAVTSPPYWGQRGNGGLGLEEDPRDYVRNLT